MAALSSALALAPVPPATPKTLVPRHPTTFFGVSDRGSVAEFKEFAGFVEKHPAVLQTFHPWGNSLKQALPRWQAVNVRPMLHISTQDDETLEELITPKAIARGRGDNYLLRLNRVLARAAQSKDEILFAEIDYAKLAESNARKLFMRHRRPELYGDWLNK